MTEGRVVAHLGRPETPEETAARKAESSRVHRNAQNFRNLIAAVLVILAVVAVIIFLVPRGTITEGEQPDAVGLAESTSRQMGEPALAVEARDGWRVNAAKLSGMDTVGTPVWNVVYAPDGDSAETGYVSLKQAFNADEDWVAQTLFGAKIDSEVEIAGITWTRFTVPAGETNGDITYAIGTPAGSSYALLYGTAAEEDFAAYATELAPGITAAKDAAHGN